MYAGNTSELFPLPPANLMRLSVAWADDERFLARGAQSFEKIRAAFEYAGAPMHGRVLEWGCGCGRMIRHALAHGYDAHGCDIDPVALAWCKENISTDRFILCDIEPVLPYESNSFDFIYAGSVITHLSLDLQFYWIKELRRILRPGGHMLLTFAGTYHFRNYYGRESTIIRAINDQPIVEAGNHQEGSNAYGIAQTIGSLDIVSPGFERKYHVQSNDILGAQDTAVYKKIELSAPTTYAMLKSEKFLDRRGPVLFRGSEEVAWVDGAIPDQLLLIPLGENLSDVNASELRANRNFELLKLVTVPAA
ncbi:class I SAM-dependent methyltransferase (plasmid) [Sinorhizobium chiapasense]